VQATTFVGDGSLLSGINTDFTNLSDINVTNFVANNTLFVSSSKVGVGIATPGQELVVDGNLNVTGNITFGTGPTTSTCGLPKDYITGLVLSTGEPYNYTNISAGVARDSNDTMDMVLSSSISKEINATWAVGDGEGGLDEGTVTNGTLYAVWLIKRGDTGVVDALISLNFTDPTMPTNYDYKRWLGWVLTGNKTGNITPFISFGDGRTLRYDYRERLNVVDGLASTTYATQALSDHIPTTTGNIIDVLFGGVVITAANTVWLSDDGINAKQVFVADYTQVDIGNPNELASQGSGYAGGDVIFVPISGDNIYYKIANGARTLTLYIRAVRFKR